MRRARRCRPARSSVKIRGPARWWRPAVPSHSSCRPARHPTTGSTTYHAQDDFSSTQGCRNWYYLYGSGTPMTFDSSTGWWQGNEPYLLLWNNGGHPGNGSDAIRRWVAPQAGSVRITGNAQDTNTACGGGVSVSIAKNATVLWQQTLANGNTAGIGFDLTTTVVQNDGVNFSINRGPDGNNACDATGFDPTIVFTPGGAPVRGPERGEPDSSGGHHRTRQRGLNAGNGEQCVEHDGADRLGHQSKSGGRHAGGDRQCRRTRRVVRPAMSDGLHDDVPRARRLFQYSRLPQLVLPVWLGHADDVRLHHRVVAGQ